MPAFPHIDQGTLMILLIRALLQAKCIGISCYDAVHAAITCRQIGMLEISSSAKLYRQHWLCTCAAHHCLGSFVLGTISVSIKMI